MATKKTVKKAAAAKKPAAAKKTTAAKKPVAVKKPAAAKPHPKKMTAAQKIATALADPTIVRGKQRKDFVRVPLRITKRPASPSKPTAEYVPIDTGKAVAAAMSIAEQMKLRAAKADRREEENGIRLSRRPTTRSQGRETEKFPATDLKEFRKRLLDARAQAASGVNAMRENGFTDADDHEADGGDGTAQTLRLQALGQMGNINRVIQQIDEALHRIDDGTYGVCTSCGQLIRKPRLLNQPFVLTCMECQQEMERERK